jgi:hypothetical protein
MTARKATRQQLDPPTPNPDFDALEAAANLLIDSFPNEMTRTILRETARSQFIPLWMLVTGIVQRSYDNGEHTSPVIDPMWLQANPVSLGDFGLVNCKTCTKEFKPRWPGEEYCCGDCGVVGYRNRIATDRAAHNQDLAIYKVGEEPPGVSRSTIYQTESDGRGDASTKVGTTFVELGDVLERADPVADIDREARQSITEKLA